MKPRLWGRSGRRRSVELVVVGSSSAGNCMMLVADEGALLIDAGFPMKEVRSRLKAAGRDLHGLDGLLVTHEHADHARGIGRFLHQPEWRVASNAGTAAALRSTFGVDGVTPLQGGAPERFGPFEVRAIPVPHDSADCCAFEIAAEGKRLVYATDLGAVPEALVGAGARADALVIESNHDRQMLWSGTYPKFLKERIAGGRGHLSNEQAGEAVGRMAGGRLRKVVLAHLSAQNNRPELAVAAVRRGLQAAAGLRAFSVEVEAAPKDGPRSIKVS